MAAKAEAVGVKKATGDALQLFALAILAGAFIGLGAIYCTTILAGGISIKDAAGAAMATTALPYGVNRLLAGLVFCLGLILVIVGGAELFTGNNLIVMAWANKKVTTAQLLRNWGIVYASNFVGWISSWRLPSVLCVTRWCVWRSGCASRRAALPTKSSPLSFQSPALWRLDLNTVSPICTSSPLDCL